MKDLVFRKVAIYALVYIQVKENFCVETLASDGAVSRATCGPLNHVV